MDMNHLELVSSIARVAHEVQRAYDQAVGAEELPPRWLELEPRARSAQQLRVITCLKAGSMEAPVEDLPRSEQERVRDAIFQGVVNAIYQR